MSASLGDMTATSPTDAQADIDPRLRSALADVYDPCCRDKGISVVDMGLLHSATVEAGVAKVEILLTSGWCPFASQVLTDMTDALRELPGIEDAAVEIVWDEAWDTARLSDSARQKLRFLPEPAAVSDPASYVSQNWTAKEETR